MGNNEKELITSDGQQGGIRIFCMTHMRRRRLNLVIVLSLVSILTLIALFGTYAYFKVYQEDSPQISITDEYFNEPSDLVRHKRATNFINKIDSERDDVDDMNKIKRNAVVEDINSFLNLKYQEINGNDANEEINDEGTLISKRSSNFKNSIRKLKENIKHNKIMINDNENVSDESINLILKDLRDIEEEIRDIDDDIISLLETAAMADNSIHKRVRHKRETNSIQNIDPITYKLYFPIFEEKKREKRLVQEKFTEVRDEFIRCKKSTKDGKRDCNEIYSKVMDRFREITKKFKEIEEIVDEMEDYHSSSRSNDSRERKKEKKKNKKKNKEEKSSSESDESSEENVKTSTPWWEQSSPSTNKTTSLEPETTTLEVTTTVEEDISTIETTNSEDMTTTQSPIETTTNDETTVQPATIFDFHDKKDSSENVVRDNEHEFFFADETVTISSKNAKSAASDTACPAKAFNENFRSHAFEEDLLGLDPDLKLSSSFSSIDDLVAKKIDRSDRNRYANVVEHISDNEKESNEEAKEFLENKNEETLDVSKSQISQFKNSDIIEASGPFISLCEQMSKQNKQAQHLPPQLPQQHQSFVQNPNAQFQTPLSGFSNVHVPPTGEISKVSSKFIVNPGYNVMPYPVCFMNYPQQHMSPYYYPAMTQPGGKQDIIDPQYIRESGYYVPSAPPSYRPIQVPVTNQYIAPNQPSYRELNNKEPPAYCTFVASDSASLPAHFTDTTESPKNQFRDDMIHKIEENTVHFNIPSQFDVIYATYPNQMFTNNHSMRLHHCDVGKLPCFGTNQCILKSKWCDSKVDCLDGSDESACSCKARLDSSRICDGYMDCPMGSDELGCFGCDKFQYSCYDNLKEFEDNRKSSTMMCYSAIEKCDGVFNCRNGKDESECSMIVNHVGGMLSYAVSHYEGILHRNHKGRWYPVCNNPNRWAFEACEMEIGKLNDRPFIAVKTMTIPGPFIQMSLDHSTNIDPIFTDDCKLRRIEDDDENNVIYVKCPYPQCGSSKVFEPKVQNIARESHNSSTRGKRDDFVRIVGGVNAKPMEFPFIVAIFKDGNFHCGGSIYDEDWIITAAHCTKFFENHFYEVQAGILRRSSYSPAAQIIKVSHVITHAEYDRGTMKNDIALMRMKHPLSFNRWVRPICLPTKERVLDNRNWKFGPPAGTLCSAIGWGAIREKGPDPDDLKVVDVPIISKCKHVVDEETQSVCAGETFGTRDACQGDSGGPFVCKSLNNPFEWYLTGIVSHGEGCARAHEPGVYTRVSLYLDWIKENTIREPPSSSDFLFAPTRIPRQECPGFVCVWGGNKCIPTSQRCDGFVDCLGGEDEIECTINLLDLLLGSNMNSSNSINPNEITEHVDETGTKSISKKDLRNELFRCTKNPQVINMDHRCDRIFDCEDGTDEENCTCRDYLKLSYPHLICDGTVDCKDESDEIGCLTCNETEFACRRSGMCIKKKLVCNGEVDCKYKEDETECLTLTNGHSVLLDLNGKPAMHSKGIVTKNVQSKWEVLCDHNDSFIINSDQIANDTCHLIGFTSGKLSKVVLLNSNAIESKYLNEKIKIDITSNPILRSNHTISKMNETCNALEIECESFHLNSLDPHSADHILIKKNKTSLHQNVYNFIPIDASDQTKLIVDPKEASDYELNDLHSFDWPWLAEIFIDGDLKANGILIKDSWILVDRNILGDSNELLQNHFIVALLGNTKSKLNIQSPYEQIMNVDCLQFVSNSNVMLFHLETPVDYNRYVLPSILPTHFELETESKCLAIALDSHQMTKAIELEIINDCKNSTNNVCYKQTAEVKAMNCDEEMSHRTSIIVCKTKNSSWYPNAFHQLKKGFCDFRYLVSVNNLNTKQSLKDIHQLIDHPCQKCQDHKLLPPKCEIHRCPLGKCLEKYQLCDLKSDCHDGSDENHEICFKLPTDQKPCNTSQFRCGDGKCVEKTKFCDQIPDCRDKSDEPSECTCFSYLKATSPSKICDGIRHCWDKTDEDSTYCGVNCPEKTSFNCLGSSFCVPNEMVCDKRADCPNGADEQFCNGIFQRDKKDSFGEVMERTYGIWHTKCFPKATPPSQQELEDLCKKLGFKNHPDAMARVINENNTNFASSYNNSTVDNIEVTFKNFTATKIIAYTKFSPVQLNYKFTVHLRPSKPLAKLVSWDSGDHQKCHRMEIKCIEGI